MSYNLSSLLHCKYSLRKKDHLFFAKETFDSDIHRARELFYCSNTAWPRKRTQLLRFFRRRIGPDHRDYFVSSGYYTRFKDMLTPVVIGSWLFYDYMYSTRDYQPEVMLTVDNRRRLILVQAGLWSDVWDARDGLDVHPKKYITGCARVLELLARTLQVRGILLNDNTEVDFGPSCYMNEGLSNEKVPGKRVFRLLDESDYVYNPNEGHNIVTYWMGYN